MICYPLYLLVFLLVRVKSDVDLLQWTSRDLNSKTIDVYEHCKGKTCVIKCCPPSEVMHRGKCNSTAYDKFKSEINYEKITVNQFDVSSNKTKDTGKRVEWIQNDFLLIPNMSVPFYTCVNHILEDGSLMQTGQYCPESFNKLSYCVDYVVTKNLIKIQFSAKYPIYVDKYASFKLYYTAIGMLTSSLFMFLVLLVYSALPALRNIGGMVLMGYTGSLMIGYALKALQLIKSGIGISQTTCRVTSPAVYYFLMSSFFWMNVMSFDLWWTIRGTRKQLAIHRQGELMKFFWYGVYAWGVPLLLTLIFVAIDRYEVIQNKNYAPPFAECFNNDISSKLYMVSFQGVMIAVNVILFGMTAYNVWRVKQAIRNNDNSRINNSKHRFILYIKLSIVMGVSWILELLPDMDIAPFVICFTFNLFVGVIIFILFVCKTSIILKLCKRFNINNRLVDKLESRQRNTTLRTTTSDTRKARCNEDEKTETLPLNSCTASSNL